MVDIRRWIRVALSALLLVVTSCRCSTADAMNHTITCDVKVYNRSPKDIRFVSIDPEGVRKDFGFLPSGDGNKFKGVISSQMPLSKEFSVMWTENGEVRKVPIDILKYDNERSQIKSMSFYYLGNGKWQVIARSGADEDSPEIKP